jgi:hypothetical protein
MNKKNFIKLLKDIPDDYEMCLSSYMKFDANEFDKHEDGEEISDDDGYTFVTDMPVIAVATSDENKEIRLVIQGYDVAKDLDDVRAEL